MKTKFSVYILEQCLISIFSWREQLYIPLAKIQLDSKPEHQVQPMSALNFISIMTGNRTILS